MFVFVIPIYNQHLNRSPKATQGTQAKRKLSPERLKERQLKQKTTPRESIVDTLPQEGPKQLDHDHEARRKLEGEVYLESQIEEDQQQIEE